MRSRSLILLVAVTSIVMLGCGEDSPISDLRPGGTGTPSVTVAPDPGQPDPGDGEVAAPVATPAPEPEAEQPEPEQPEPEQPEPEAPPIDPADDDSSLVPILLGIGLLVLAAVVVGAVVSRRSSAPDERRAASPVPAPTPSPQMVLLTNAQWIHDHLTLELLAVPPSDALLRWTTERRRLDDVAIGAEQQFVNGSGDAWSSLNQTMTALANALDTNLRLRAQVPPDPAVIQESTAVVNRQRAVLIQLVAALWPTAAPPPTQR